MNENIIPGPGFHPGLSDDTYFTRMVSTKDGPVYGLSKSDAVFLQAPYTPAHFRAHVDERKPEINKAFEYGSAAHLMALGVGPEIVVIPDSVGVLASGKPSTSPRMTAAYKDAVAQVRDSGKIPLNEDEATALEGMKNALLNNPVSAEILTDPTLQAEVARCAQDKTSGVYLLGKADLLGADVIVDYKTTGRLADPASFTKTCWDYHYALQTVWYQSITELLGQPRKKFVFLVQEKQSPYLVAAYSISETWLEIARLTMAAVLERYAECLNANNWPGYPEKIQELLPPGWAPKTSAPKTYLPIPNATDENPWGFSDPLADN
jgi:hypothetical protein